MPDLICDFCSSEKPAFVYPADTFTDEGATSLGGWTACQECASFIEAGEWDRLARQGLKTPTAKTALALGLMTQQSMLDRIALLHRKFRSHRSGPRWECIA